MAELSITIDPTNPRDIERLRQTLIAMMDEAPPERETHIGLVVDCSGSMHGLEEQVVNGYNQVINDINKELAKVGTVFFYSVFFGENLGTVRVQDRHRPLQNEMTLPTLAYQDYTPHGDTPLRDGVGKMIEEMQQYDTPDKDVAFVIHTLTDGAENASRKWGQARLRERIQYLEGTNRWSFVGAIANLNLDRFVQDFGVRRGNWLLFQSSRVGTQSMYNATSNSMSSFMRGRGVSGQSSTGGTFYDNDASQNMGEVQKELEVLKQHLDNQEADKSAP